MDINILLLAAAGFAVINMVRSYKIGMVKAFISLVALIVLCVTATLLVYGIGGYLQGDFLHVIIAVFLLTLLGIVHHLLDVVFFSAKMIAKLPVVHSADKLLGVVFGALETVLILWTVYTFVMMVDLGRIENFISLYTDQSVFLKWLYEHNYLARGFAYLLQKFDFIPLEELLFIAGSL